MKRPSRWHLISAKRQRGNDLYAKQRLEEQAAIKARQQLVTMFVTGGRHSPLDRCPGIVAMLKNQ